MRSDVGDVRALGLALGEPINGDPATKQGKFAYADGLVGTPTAPRSLAKGPDGPSTAAATAIEARFHHHKLADVILSLPGMGLRLGAEFLAAVGDLSSFASADHLAAYAGLVPVPTQAIIAVARRRLNVLWALIRDNRT